MRNYKKLHTPFGCISINIDGNDQSYNIEKLPLKDKYKDVLGRYLLSIDYLPNNQKHVISCEVENITNTNIYHESSQQENSIVLFNELYGIELAICVYGDGYEYVFKDGDYCCINEDDDYDIAHTPKGISYIVNERTKTTKYLFVIAWIDHVRDTEYQPGTVNQNRLDQVMLASSIFYYRDRMENSKKD